jgi:hypothetical protein
VDLLEGDQMLIDGQVFAGLVRSLSAGPGLPKQTFVGLADVAEHLGLAVEVRPEQKEEVVIKR